MAPLVRLFGWRGAFLLPLLSLVATVVMTAGWLKGEGLPLLFALLVLAYLPGLVLSRVAMSDGISAAIVTASLVLFWRGARSAAAWGLSGFLAGASILFRETNPLVLAPFFLGALLRREPRAWALVVGGLIGASLRLPLALWVFGDPLFAKQSSGFSAGAAVANLPLYLFATTVLVPGGLACTLLYRGRRRPELMASVLSFVLVYSAYNYNARSSGPLKQIVLSGRFMLPVVPLLAFSVAHVLTTRLRQFRVPLAPRAVAAAPGLGASSAIAIVVATIGFMDAWNHGQSRLQSAVDGVLPADAIVVGDQQLTRKLFNPLLHGSRSVLNSATLQPESYGRLLERHGEFYLAQLDRSDSRYHERRTEANREIRRLIAQAAIIELIFDDRTTTSDRLRIWRVSSPSMRAGDAREPAH